MKKYLCFFFILLLNSCVSQETKKADFLFDVKKGARNAYEYDFILTQELVDQFQMIDLSKGYDSLYIRVWYHYSRDIRVQVFDIYKANSEWKSAYNLVLRNDIKDTPSVIFRNVEVKKDYHKIDSLYQKIKTLGIMTLPTESSIPNYRAANDGAMVFVEVATKNSFRIYSYGNPRLNPDISEANKIGEIMKEIDKYFQIKKVWDF